jgi:hypothetical protein
VKETGRSEDFHSQFGILSISATSKIPGSIDFERYGNRSCGADLLTTMYVSRLAPNECEHLLRIYRRNFFGLASITGSVITGNVIEEEAVDIATKVNVHFNDLLGEKIGVDNLNTAGRVDATENWWGSRAAPVWKRPRL